MELKRYGDIRAFHRDVIDLLVREEVENNLPIGILDRGIQGECKDDWFMARIEDEQGQTRLIALMTPPHNIILTSLDSAAPMCALELLTRELLEGGISTPGVLAEKQLSHAFAGVYTGRLGTGYRVQTDERVYRLDEVADVPKMGELRLMGERDMFYLPYWMRDFRETCFSTRETLDIEGSRNAIEKKRYYVLEVDGQPVSLVGTTRQMPNGRSVGPVYTPPHFRARGYASDAVAQISRLIQSWGNAYCALFTDLANPTSNSIYQKVGYRPLRDYAEISFD